MSGTAEPRRAAVLGHPIGHSLSPTLHGAAYRLLGVAIEYSRRAIDLEALPQFLAGEGAEDGWVGWSVTMPLKAAMVDHMTSISDRVDALGVLNTVVHGPDGLHGENTDVDGIVTALGDAGLRKDMVPGADGFGIIGAGATATASLAAAAELGFSEVRIYARSPGQVAALQPIGEALGVRCQARHLEDLREDLSGDELSAVVSTLPPRAADTLASQVPHLTRPLPLLDVAYDPWPSMLAQAWERAGGHVISGLVMLLHQAVAQVELFTAHLSRPAGVLSPDQHEAMVERMRAAVGL